MYEKLCAILDALRERGISCKAETNAYTGVWEILAMVPVTNGVKLIRYPLAYSIMRKVSATTLVQIVCEEVLA